MARKVTTKKPLFGNKRSHALNTTKHCQKLNMQNVTLPNGEVVSMTVREAKKYKNASTMVEEVISEEIAA